MEKQWWVRYESANPIEGQIVYWQDCVTRISSQFYGQSHYSLAEWKTTLSGFSRQLLQLDFVPTLLLNNVQRLSITTNNDLTCSHYLFQYDKTINRLEKYIRESVTYRRHLLNLHGQIQLGLPPPSFSIFHVVPDLPLVGSPFILRYLGQYPKIFDDPTEVPMPTWTIISWLLEDCGLSRT